MSDAITKKDLDDLALQLVNLLEPRLKAIETRLEKTATQESLEIYASVVDAYAKQSETYMQEMLALGRKVERLEEWIMKVAEATGVKLAT